jgi:Fe-S-cluster-containing dehydrogenase component
MAAQKNLLIDANLCTGCRLCELVCSLTKERECRPANARIRCESYIIEGLRFPRVCVNCTKPACVEVCAVEALRKDEATGYVELDYNECTKCEACVEACPYGAIRLTPDGEVIKCDLCNGDPECVKVCETHAIRFDEHQPQHLTRARRGLVSYTDKVILEA